MQRGSDPGAESAANAFVEKWSRVELTERAASHEHFLDLCRLLDQPTPASADATGENYCFEKYVKVVRSASKGSKGDGGFVDVWWRGKFAWEYKQKDKYANLDEAYRQLYQYRDALDNPPLSVVCDIRTTIIYTHFVGYPRSETRIELKELPGKLEVLRRVFTDPDSFRRTLKTTETITQELAQEFGDLADGLIQRYPPDDLALWESAGSPVAHFLMKVMFCLFAEDIGLLPSQAFTKLINLCLFKPEDFQAEATNLFNLMRTGGRFGFDRIEWFNGGLFDDAPALPLKHGDITTVRRVAGDAQNWAGVEPSIFGTLFERILDPKKRAQIGAHYTSRDDILLVVDPVVMTPLRRRWQQVQDQLAPALAKHDAEPDRKKRDVHAGPVRVLLDGYRRWLAEQRILDPACGSGNFLYVALQQLLDLEYEVVKFAAKRDITLDPIPYVRPTQFHGIEINPYAAELAQVVIWIGYLQWMHVHGIDNPKRPILDKLQSIENRDAILDLSDKKNPAPAKWPEADFIIGNPPFLGTKMLRGGLGDDYTTKLWSTFAGRIPGFSDLCCYRFELGRGAIEAKPQTRVGLLATQAIRNEGARVVLERIKKQGDIFLAWGDREWLLDGAAVHVAIVGFTGRPEEVHILDGKSVPEIHANLTAGVNLTEAQYLAENGKVGWSVGTQKGGAFNMSWEKAAELLRIPAPTPRPVTDVLMLWANGLDLTRRFRGEWIVYFDPSMTFQDAASFGPIFEHVAKEVGGFRKTIREQHSQKRWWLHQRPREDFEPLRRALPRFLATPRVSKYRIFTWLDRTVLPDCQIIAFARSDDYFLGVLHSSLQELWARGTGTQLREAESGFRYTPSSTFETFPFPWPPGREDVNHPAYARIASAAKALDEQRERWLNPPEWLDPLSAKVDAADDFADVPPAARPLVRRSAILAAAARDPRLKKRTLTNLYNERPTWLRLAHQHLDRAVLAAYAATDPEVGWDEVWADVWVDTGAGQPLAAEHPVAVRRAEVDRLVLANLLRLNCERAVTGE